MDFDKLPRSYSTPNGCCLATYEEARKGLETIKKKGLLEKWERARLLDGWISGPGYDFQMGNDFRGCMAFMLVIKLDEQANITSGTLYKDIALSKNQKEVAFLLCTEDWNYEVVYWVLNSLSGSETMDLREVTQGNIPFSDAAKFKEMNTMMHHIARKFVEEGPASEIAAKRKFSEPNSVQEVLSGMIEFVEEQEHRAVELCGGLELKADRDSLLIDLNKMLLLESTWLADATSQGGVTWEAIVDPFWNFLSESFALWMVINLAYNGMLDIYCNAITSSQGNIILASQVLLYMSVYADEIIYAPLPDNGEFNPAKMILCSASEEEEQQPERLNKMLQDNALGRCYEESGNYELLDKLLIFPSRGKGRSNFQEGRDVDICLINRLLACGAKPGRSLRSRKSKTALHYEATWEDEKVAKSLLEICDKNNQENFVNAQDCKKRTALHKATELGYTAVCKFLPVCKLLLDYGARLDVRDERGQTVLHNAVKLGEEEVLDLFRNNNTFTTCLDMKDEDGNTPLDKKNIEVVAQLLWMSGKPEAYFSKVDLKRLLRQSLLKGYVEIVKLLLDKGEELPADVDDRGKTTLHLATMCENEEKAWNMVFMILQKSEDKQKAVAMYDSRRRNVSQEAALKGHAGLCDYLLGWNPSLINDKDQDGRNALYDAVQCKDDSSRLAVWKALYGAYRKRDRKLDDLTGRSGLTPLHVAAEKGRKNIVEDILTGEKEIKRRQAGYTAVYKAANLGDRETVDIVKRADFLGQTSLHKAARSGDKSTVQTLLENGAHPFEERDCDGRTALHYVVERAGKGGKETGKEGQELAMLLLSKCKSEEEKLLLLWASAAGVGPADKNLTDPNLKELEQYLSQEKKRLKQILLKERNLL